MSWITTGSIGIALVALAALLAWREHGWLLKARFADGTVIDLVPVGRKRTVAPRVAFTGADGLVREFTRGYGSSPPEFSVGEKIVVAYDPENHEARILTFGQRFGFAAIIVSVGLALLFWTLCHLAGSSLVPRLYES